MTTIRIKDVQEKISEQCYETYRKSYGWHYVRVWPDGDIQGDIDVSRCFPMSGYSPERCPHPVTVWSQQVNYSSGAGIDMFMWVPCAPDEATFYADAAMVSHQMEPDDEHTVPCRLDEDDPIVSIDVELLMPAEEIRRALEAAGYEVED
jgi:hypothetical protein